MESAETPANPYQYLRAFAWTGPVFILIIVIFWGLLGQNIPPYSAALDAETFAREFTAHASQIRVGMSVQVMAGALYLLWTLAVTKVMEAAEYGNDVMSRLQMWGGGLTVVIFMLPPTLWLTAAFRPEAYGPQLLQMLYDLGWIQFDLTVTVTSCQFAAFGICFLQDRRPVPLMPKWLSWLGIYIAVMFLLLVFMPSFKSGPFSRSGVLSYWTEFGLFFIFWALASYYLIVAVGRLEREYAASIGSK
jgi:hypothetical protein